jgi:hypothetical protein
MTTPVAPASAASPGASGDRRTLHVRCTTWDQVTAFISRKLRRGKLLSMKVPFPTEPGAPVTLGLELPDGLVIAIDGSVLRASPVEGDRDKTWIEIELVGFTDDVFARIKAMASGSSPANAPSVPAPVAPRASITQVGGDALPEDERELFQHLTSELRRLRALPVHEVLGVARDADPDELRLGWMEHVSRHHPDLFARRNAPAISHLAEELTILCNRAYDRLRAAVVAEGRGAAFGPAIAAPAGWLVGTGDGSSDGSAPANLVRTPRPSAMPPLASTAAAASGSGRVTGQHAAVAPPPAAAAASGNESYETRARAMLADGNPEFARELLAAALCVYPRSKPLRSLYYVASAVSALEQGEVMLATSQLETALAHFDQCLEAARLLDHLRKHGPDDLEGVKRLFK